MNITGGNSGTGLETAHQFLAEGATVAITGRSKQKLLEIKKVRRHCHFSKRCGRYPPNKLSWPQRYRNNGRDLIFCI
nr:SDR family NAD(P)-dependent oxidoreductase [Candidatus Symbiopectobacterium sp. 'North America']